MKILFLGHSLVEYGDWGRLLPGYAVVNLGRAGETTAGLLRRLDHILAEHPAANAVCVMSGTNDILAGDPSFLAEYRRVARRLRRAYPRARIVLHGLLPVDPDWAAPPELAAANLGIARVAGETGLMFLDLTERFADPDGRPRGELYDADGVHLSEEGYRAWAEALREVLPHYS